MSLGNLLNMALHPFVQKNARIASLELEVHNLHMARKGYQSKIDERDATIADLRRQIVGHQQAIGLTTKALDGAIADLDRWKHQAGVNHTAQLDAMQKLQDAEKARKLALVQVQAFRDAVEYLAGRAKASPEELAQLGLGTVIPGDRKKGEGDTFVFGDLMDLKDSIDFAMHNQATVAKFRQIKEHFVKHQQAVTILLDAISSVTRKNEITADDHNKLRSLRESLSSLIRRPI